MNKALDAALEAVSKIGKPEVVEAHTPTPWKVAETKPGNLTFIWRNDTGENHKNTGYARIAQHLSKDDAAFIVRACNAHDALVECVKDAFARETDLIRLARYEKALKLAREG